MTVSAEEEETLEARLGHQVIKGRISPNRARFLLLFAYAMAFSAAFDGEMRPSEIHEEMQRYGMRFGKIDRRTIAYRRQSPSADVSQGKAERP